MARPVVVQGLRFLAVCEYLIRGGLGALNLLQTAFFGPHYTSQREKLNKPDRGEFI
jgi:hypothetical protein